MWKDIRKYFYHTVVFHEISSIIQAFSRTYFVPYSLLDDRCVKMPVTLFSQKSYSGRLEKHVNGLLCGVVWCDIRYQIKEEGMINYVVGKLGEVILEFSLKNVSELHIDFIFQTV